MSGNRACRSRGFIGPGRRSPESAILGAAARGVDLRTHISRLLEPSDLVAAPLVLVMNAKQRRQVCALAGPASGARVIVFGDLDPERIQTREVRDPWGQDDDVFQQSFARIDRILNELHALLPRA